VRSSAVTIVSVIWLAWLAIWLAASLDRKHTRVRDTLFSRMVQLITGAAIYLLMFSRDLPLAWLDARVVPGVPALEAFGISLTILGIVFSLWARIHLGRNWSGAVRIGEDHELIRSGPYARIRHPIYSGLLLALAGSSLVMGNWRSFAAVIVGFLGFAFKAKREERLLSREFGSAFELHRRQTGFFLPRFSSRADAS
jgi:protein-S-isoprenylcysteine O-methyltransferase Ste14